MSVYEAISEFKNRLLSTGSFGVLHKKKRNQMNDCVFSILKN